MLSFCYFGQFRSWGRGAYLEVQVMNINYTRSYNPSMILDFEAHNWVAKYRHKQASITPHVQVRLNLAQ